MVGWGFQPGDPFEGAGGNIKFAHILSVLSAEAAQKMLRAQRFESRRWLASHFREEEGVDLHRRQREEDELFRIRVELMYKAARVLRVLVQATPGSTWRETYESFSLPRAAGSSELIRWVRSVTAKASSPLFPSNSSWDLPQIPKLLQVARLTVHLMWVQVLAAWWFGGGSECHRWGSQGWAMGWNVQARIVLRSKSLDTILKQTYIYIFTC